MTRKLFENTCTTCTQQREVGSLLHHNRSQCTSHVIYDASL